MVPQSSEFGSGTCFIHLETVEWRLIKIHPKRSRGSAQCDSEGRAIQSNSACCVISFHNSSVFCSLSLRHTNYVPEVLDLAIEEGSELDTLQRPLSKESCSDEKVFKRPAQTGHKMNCCCRPRASLSFAQLTVVGLCRKSEEERATFSMFTTQHRKVP